MADAGATVVVCVHDGQGVLRTTLAALASQVVQADLRVVVACNGCRDRSVEVARSMARAFAAAGHDYRVLDLPVGSRSGALNTAERLARGLRVYVDQDAVVAPGGLQALLDALAAGRHFATLRPRLRGPASPLVRAYFRAWGRCAYVRESPVTIGLYAVSASGRARWGGFPPLHSDDKFARLQFDRAERTRLERWTYSVRAPATLRELVRARSRYASGNRELSRLRPDLAARDAGRYAGLVRLTARPRLWPAGAVLVSVHALAAAHRALLAGRPRR